MITQTLFFEFGTGCTDCLKESLASALRHLRKQAQTMYEQIRRNAWLSSWPETAEELEEGGAGVTYKSTKLSLAISPVQFNKNIMFTTKTGCCYSLRQFMNFLSLNFSNTGE